MPSKPALTDEQQPPGGASASCTHTEASPSLTGEVGLAPRLPVPELEAMARRLRRHVVQMIGTAGSGHPGGSLSAVDIITVLYFDVLRHRPGQPCWEGRDRFVLSKGHAAPALYAALIESGYLPKELLLTLRRPDSPLQGHVDMNLCPGIEMSAGSLGQGLSVAVGMALAARLDRQQHRVYALLGDGECDEGQVWEAFMAAAHFKVHGRPLDNLTAIVDHNKLQLDGWTRDIMNLEPLAPRFRSFGWRAIETDGHNIEALLAAFQQAQQTEGQPSVIVAHTTKGKGVSFMENNPEFHGKAPTEAQVAQALEELK